MRSGGKDPSVSSLGRGGENSFRLSRRANGLSVELIIKSLKGEWGTDLYARSSKGRVRRSQKKKGQMVEEGSWKRKYVVFRGFFHDQGANQEDAQGKRES